MKKIVFALLCLSVAIFASCGNAEEEARKEKILQDSLSEIDGGIAIDRANQQILGESTHVSSDSITKIDTKANK
ncbi:MAG: hypothetical protein V1904_10210 [Bacteroidota bacterium]